MKFNLPMARWAFEHARAAYGDVHKPPPVLDTVGRARGFLKALDPGRGAQALVTRYGGQETNSHLVVAVAGSSEVWQDWVMADLRSGFWRSKHPPVGGRVGTGFLWQAQPLMEAVATTIQLEHPPSDPITIAGHSLGVPVGILLAVDLLDRGYSNVQVHGFGPPRAFGRRAAEYINEELYGLAWIRVYMNTARGRRDLVTLLPPGAWGFDHVGWLTVLAKDCWFEGPDAVHVWNHYKSLNPQPTHLAWWRIVSSLRARIRAHSGDQGQAFLDNLNSDQYQELWETRDVR